MPNAIISGATHGIGKAIAEKFLQEGFSIAICARSEKDLAAAEAYWNEAYPAASIFTFAADLGNKKEAFAFGNFCLAQMETIDALVNNAGIFLPGSIAEEPDGQLEKMMDVNLFSAYHLTRQILPKMKAQQQGHIFNICSVASLMAYENGGAYSITKYALQGFSENLRLELMPHGVKVTALMPGATWSRSWEHSGLPESRLMQANDVADAVWMAFDLSKNTVVETIVLRL